MKHSDVELDINELKTSLNIVPLLDESQLSAIAKSVIRGYKIDEESRQDWLDITDKAMAIAKQTPEVKNTPWPNASNIKYPLITKSSIDYAARAYPEFVKDDKVVKMAIIGKDLTNEKALKSERVATHMSYQLLKRDTEWEDSLDRLLHVLPVVGTVFKKTYYDVVNKKLRSEFCTPERVSINMNVASLEDARRVTHIVGVYTNDLISSMREGLYTEIDVDSLKGYDNLVDGPVAPDDLDPKIDLLEQHTYLDLDGDGYLEPYIVTIHEATGTILQIVNRFEAIIRKNKKIIRIDPVQFFTDYHLIRNPDGGFYSMGFGHLLYPLNNSVNTILNQLTDAGTLANQQTGFIGKGLRLRSGQISAERGTYKVLDVASGTDIAKNIYTLPVKEPSQVLFQLLGLLIEASKDLSSSTDVLAGKGPSQNVPATTILTQEKQGLKVFNGIHKRLHKSQKKELIKVFKILKEHTTNEEYRRILDDPLADLKLDYNTDELDILPVSDPNMASDTQRIQKAQAVMSLSTVDPRKAEMELLKALNFSDAKIQELMPEPDPNAPPPPEVEKTKAETQKLLAETQQIQAEMQMLNQKLQIEIAKLEASAADTQTRRDESDARIEKMQSDAIEGAAKVQIAAQKSQDESAQTDEAQIHKENKETAELSLKASETKQKDKED